MPLLAGTRRTRQQITLEIAAESSNNVKMIKEELKQVEQSHLRTIILWQKFDERQLAEILEVQDLHCVRIECEPVIAWVHQNQWSCQKRTKCIAGNSSNYPRLGVRKTPHGCNRSRGFLNIFIYFNDFPYSDYILSK
jgi:hypothetical protein